MSIQNNEEEWYEPYATFLAPGYLEQLQFEHRSTRLLTFGMEIVQGIFQTEDYARTVLGQVGVDFFTTSERDTRLEIRMKRQQELFERKAKTKIHIHALLDEAIVHRQIGGKQIFIAQLYHLLELAQLPTITMQVLPFSLGKTWPTVGMLGFEIYYAGKESMISSEPGFMDQSNSHNEIEVGYYAGIFRSLSDQALSKDESLELIRRRIAEVEKELMNASPSNN